MMAAYVALVLALVMLAVVSVGIRRLLRWWPDPEAHVIPEWRSRLPTI